MKDYKRIFRKNLRNLVESKGMNITQGEIAQQIGISPAALTRYLNEDKDIRTDVLIMIADYFNVSVDYLLGRHKGIKDDERIIVTSKETNLSEESIKKLKSMSDRKKNIVNKIIESQRSVQLLEKIENYLDNFIEELDCNAKLDILKTVSAQSGISPTVAIAEWLLMDEFPVSNPENRMKKYYALTHNATAFDIMSDFKEILLSISNEEMEQEQNNNKEKAETFINSISKGMESYLSSNTILLTEESDNQQIFECIDEELKPMVKTYMTIKTEKQPLVLMYDEL